ncbi:P22AR C-terminal domain-containing protein [Enterobacter hormaechei]|uniref:P22AR C-terminal domain-containing protein n=1 Tax=Enterobacter hormaechei TaxID=158836 RepID=UPI001E31F475|nr:P22AR C-terminal domain-containing protein [Enterobacter hormaechei]
MNIVAKSDYNFQGFAFNPVPEGGAIWFTSTELAKALGYKKTDAISQIYARNADEFSESMSLTLNMKVNGINNSLRNKSVRVYSLRGAHLVAMFASTPKAKDFRRWALDILDREVQDSPIAKQFSDEELVSLCYLQLWMEKSQQISKKLYPAMRELGSELSGKLRDIAHETRYMTDETKKILLRETQNLDNTNFVVSSAQPVLAKLRGEDGWIH